jgi:hypothetical protein
MQISVADLIGRTITDASYDSQAKKLCLEVDGTETIEVGVELEQGVDGAFYEGNYAEEQG